MHTYVRPTTIPDPFPSFAELRFNDALDVVAYAELNLSIGLNTWPEMWHLNEHGQLVCAGPRSSCDSMKRWARAPDDLFGIRREGLATGGCGDHWLIVDSRPHGLDPPPDEGDVQAFLVLCRKLRRIGVHLLDAVVFDDEGHWWSMHELTAGTTAWAPSVP